MVTTCRGPLTVAVVAAAALAHAPSSARACGGFFMDTTSSDVVTVSDVRVLFVKTPGWVDQYVQVGYGGQAKRFAWIYPVPGNPKVEAVESSPFGSLEQTTRPRVEITVVRDDDDGGCGGCGWGAADDGAKASGGNGRQAGTDVKVWQAGQTGSFDYVVITATESDEMLTWLGDNGFAIPASTAEVLDHYIAQKWFFVAMKISVQSVSADIPATTVIRLGYDADTVRYPLRMVSLSPAASTSFEFYLVSAPGWDNELTPAAPFSAANIDPAAVEAISETEHNYEQVFARTLGQGPRTLVREFSSRNWSSADAKLQLGTTSVLTRLRTTLTAAEMDRDIEFEPRPHQDVSSTFSVVYDPAAGRSSLPPAAPLALVAALLIRRALRRRRRP